MYLIVLEPRSVQERPSWCTKFIWNSVWYRRGPPGVPNSAEVWGGCAWRPWKWDAGRVLAPFSLPESPNLGRQARRDLLPDSTETGFGRFVVQVGVRGTHRDHFRLVFGLGGGWLLPPAHWDVPWRGLGGMFGWAGGGCWRAPGPVLAVLWSRWGSGKPTGTTLGWFSVLVGGGYCHLPTGMRPGGAWEAGWGGQVEDVGAHQDRFWRFCGPGGCLGNPPRPL